jgi:hypothetical protein
VGAGHALRAPLGEHLVFKGGTSLSKAYQVIRRFSEDVDLTYDIRAIAPDLVGDNGEGLPKTRSEEKRWSSEVRGACRMGRGHRAAGDRGRAGREGLAAAVRVEDEKLFIDYEATAAGSGYVAPSVMLEFGARSTGEPASLRDVVCDAAGLIEGLLRSRQRGRASCTRSGPSGRRRPPSTSSASRSGCAATASHDTGTMLSDWMKPASRKPLSPIASWPTLSPATSRCSSEKAADRTPIDYAAAVSGGLQLVPVGDGAKALEG